MNTRPEYNPYDFANPVIDMRLLADRSEERREIEYYLDHAANAPRPINIALIGHRASGKTSLLNFTEEAARQRGFFSVRLNLDTDISSNQLSFFFNILDSIIQKACLEHYFNGISGRIYDTYLDLVTKYETSAPKEFCVFLFALRYAKFMQTSAARSEVPNNVIQADLEVIRKEIRKPIVLLFDECNTIIQNRELLQKLRNIFMNLPGFMVSCWCLPVQMNYSHF
jgi:AAA+ ATPase superfamily predicted ATPase